MSKLVHKSFSPPSKKETKKKKEKKGRAGTNRVPILSLLLEDAHSHFNV